MPTTIRQLLVVAEAAWVVASKHRSAARLAMYASADAMPRAQARDCPPELVARYMDLQAAYQAADQECRKLLVTRQSLRRAAARGSLLPSNDGDR